MFPSIVMVSRYLLIDVSTSAFNHLILKTLAVINQVLIKTEINPVFIDENTFDIFSVFINLALNNKLTGWLSFNKVWFIVEQIKKTTFS